MIDTGDMLTEAGVCRHHPGYRAIRRPKMGCPGCWLQWLLYGKKKVADAQALAALHGAGLNGRVQRATHR